jgi:hypothetical protein
MEQQQVSVGLADRVVASPASRFFTEHPGVGVSALYLASSAIGMLDSWWYYRQFNIDIFLYSDLADFLLASFRSSTAWLVVGLTGLVTGLDQFVSRRVARKSSPPRRLLWLGSQRYRQFSAALGILAGVAYILFYAEKRADWIADGRFGQQVQVSLANAAPRVETAVMLGSTLNFVFLLDRLQGTVGVHPYENVLAIVANAEGI